MRFYEHIDKIIYINLDKRKDRDIEIKNEFKRLGIPPEKIIRFSAVANSYGAIGCSLSHLAIISMAKNNKFNNVLVLEDDFNFIDSSDIIDKAFDDFFNDYKNNYDAVCLCRGYYYNAKPIQKTYLEKAVAVSTTAGYLVNSTMYDKLIENIHVGVYNLNITRDQPKYAVDQYWARLQNSERWYVFNPSLGYQRQSYSDISDIYVDYTHMDKSLKLNKTTITNDISGNNLIDVSGN